MLLVSKLPHELDLDPESAWLDEDHLVCSCSAYVDGREPGLEATCRATAEGKGSAYEWAISSAVVATPIALALRGASSS